MAHPTIMRVNPQCDLARVRRVFLAELNRRNEGRIPSHQAIFFQVQDPKTKSVVPVFDCNNVAELAQKFASTSDGEHRMTVFYQCENTYG